MNIKKEAHEEVVDRLRRSLEDVHCLIKINKREINRISDKQRVLKKERAELCLLIRKLTPEK